MHARHMNAFKKKLLTKGELECLYLAAQDFTTYEAAEKLNRTVDTIKKRRYVLMQKLGCNTIAGAVILGIKMQLLDGRMLLENPD